ncbi:MAG: 2-C-methyl-D-erythritol 4-phosphate cytidylyltransferase [Candidatus Marinimicrobia bacterium]|nr:2-C-methyl-D-erythritol 4-phosphate cytidylyltransferase [Candidatus Neomarinimicrobiota bacterium]
MNHTIPKQFFPLHGKPIITYSLETMETVSEIDRIIVVYNKDFRSVYEELFDTYIVSKCVLDEGGDSRQDSVWNGFKNR